MILKMKNSKSLPNKILHYCNDKAIANDTYNMICFATDNTNKKIKEFNDLLKDKKKIQENIIT